MFFLVSKLLVFLLNPAVWILTALFIGICTKCKTKRKRTIYTSIFIILFFGNSFIIDEVVRAWEIPAVELQPEEQYEYGVLLSGMTKWDPELNRVNFHANVDRLLQTLPIHHNGKIKELIISGGDGTAFQKEAKEAVAINDYLEGIGYNCKKIHLEPNSRNTNENAVNTEKFLRENLKYDSLNNPILLITSAMHMRRSVACFKKQNIRCVPYSTNRHAGPRKFSFDHLLIPDFYSFTIWKSTLHEMVGYCAYYMADYI